MRRFLVAAVAALLAAVALASTAAAAEPVRHDFTWSDTAVLADVCAFPVTVEYGGTGTATVFFDRDGNITRVGQHQIEQDVFTANGNTLVGIPYTYNAEFLVDPDSGEVTHAYFRGLVSRVPLPGGDVFLTAGRLDLVSHPGEPFLLQPDVGAQGNIAGFCAALAP